MEPTWKASAASASIWLDASVGTGPRGPVLRGVVELALEGGREATTLTWKGTLATASGEVAVALSPEGWDGKLAAGAKKSVELAFEGGPTLDEGAKARLVVVLSDGRGGSRAITSAERTVQKVQ